MLHCQHFLLISDKISKPANNQGACFYYKLIKMSVLMIYSLSPSYFTQKLKKSNDPSHHSNVQSKYVIKTLHKIQLSEKLAMLSSATSDMACS